MVRLGVFVATAALLGSLPGFVTGALAQSMYPTEDTFPTRNVYPSSGIPQFTEPQKPQDAPQTQGATPQDGPAQTTAARPPNRAATTTGSAYQPLGAGGYHPMGQ